MSKFGLIALDIQTGRYHPLYFKVKAASIPGAEFSGSYELDKNHIQGFKNMDEAIAFFKEKNLIHRLMYTVLADEAIIATHVLPVANAEAISEIPLLFTDWKLGSQIRAEDIIIFGRSTDFKRPLLKLEDVQSFLEVSEATKQDTQQNIPLTPADAVEQVQHHVDNDLKSKGLRGIKSDVRPDI